MPKQYYTDVFTVPGSFRIADKTINDNERDNYQVWFDEQIRIFGQKVSYYVSNYELSAHDAIYGEQTTTVYRASQDIIMMMELSEQSIVLSKFGLEGQDDVTAFIAISAYGKTFGQGQEPKSGDIFKLKEYGDDRPGTRDGKLFEVTQRRDQEISTINPLMGHYCWMIQAKRLDYTFEPGLTAEGGSDQVYDDNFSGRLSGYTNTETATKVYSDNVDTDASSVWDYTTLGSDDDDVYGDYGP